MWSASNDLPNSLGRMTKLAVVLVPKETPPTGLPSLHCLYKHINRGNVWAQARPLQRALEFVTEGGISPSKHLLHFSQAEGYKQGSPFGVKKPMDPPHGTPGFGESIRRKAWTRRHPAHSPAAWLE